MGLLTPKEFGGRKRLKKEGGLEKTNQVPGLLSDWNKRDTGRSIMNDTVMQG